MIKFLLGIKHEHYRWMAVFAFFGIIGFFTVGEPLSAVLKESFAGKILWHGVFTSVGIIGTMFWLGLLYKCFQQQFYSKPAKWFFIFLLLIFNIFAAFFYFFLVEENGFFLKKNGASRSSLST